MQLLEIYPTKITFSDNRVRRLLRRSSSARVRVDVHECETLAGLVTSSFEADVCG